MTFFTPMTPATEIARLIQSLRPVSSPQALIRLGPDSDGGYLIPDDLQGVSACFSPGVSTISGFEEDCAARGLSVFLADHSVDGPAVPHNRFHFTRKHVGAVNSAEFITMDRWVESSRIEPHTDLLLQMDIEGAEYETILNLSEQLLKRFRIMVIEFHLLDMLWSAPFFLFAARAFEKLLQHHLCVHLHPNNCCGQTVVQELEIPRIMEFTFQRRDHASFGLRKLTFPHAMDQDNTSNRELPLPFCWIRD